MCACVSVHKMVGSIAGKLLSLINAIPFKCIIPALPSGCGLSEHVYPKTILAKNYSLDISRWLDSSYMNLNALFELFREYSNESGMTVRQNMLKYLGITKKKGAETSTILQNVWIALHLHEVTPRQWADSMMSREKPGDEIALYCLCCMYQWHCVIITSAKMWTTMDIDAPATSNELLESCPLRLLYIEPGVFGELHPKPAMPAPPKSPVFESAML